MCGDLACCLHFVVQRPVFDGSKRKHARVFAYVCAAHEQNWARFHPGLSVLARHKSILESESRTTDAATNTGPDAIAVTHAHNRQPMANGEWRWDSNEISVTLMQIKAQLQKSTAGAKTEADGKELMRNCKESNQYLIWWDFGNFNGYGNGSRNGDGNGDTQLKLQSVKRDRIQSKHLGETSLSFFSLFLSFFLSFFFSFILSFFLPFPVEILLFSFVSVFFCFRHQYLKLRC